MLQTLGPTFLDPKASGWGPTVGACACLRGYMWHLGTRAHPRSVGPHPEALGLRKVDPKGWQHGLSLF